MALHLKWLYFSFSGCIQVAPYSDLWCHVFLIIYLLQIIGVIDLIVNIRDHLQGATQWWNGLPAIVVTTTMMINNSECASLKWPVWNHLCNFSNIQQGGGNYHEAMMTPRDSSTSPAVSLCWGSNTSSFRIRHTVFSDTRPSLWGGGREQKRQFYLKVYSHCGSYHYHKDYTASSSGSNLIWKCGNFSGNL